MSILSMSGPPAIVLCVLVASAPALAQKKKAPPKEAAAATAADPATTEAKARVKKAATLYKQARYKEAIAEFEAAYKLKPHGAILFNIAQAHEKLGDIPAALRGYHEYLRQVPDADDRANVQLAMKNLEKRLAEKGVQQLLVYSEPSGAKLQIDGEQRGTTPFAAELPLGVHRVAVEIEGYQLKTREVVLSADTSVALDFTLERVTETTQVPLVIAPDPAPPPPELKKPEPEPPPPVAIVAPPVEPPPPPPAKGRLWTYVAGGAAAAAIAGGAAFGLMAKGDSDRLLANKQPDRATATALANSAQGKAGTANLLYGVGAAAGAAAAVLFFVEGTF